MNAAVTAREIFARGLGVELEPLPGPVSESRPETWSRWHHDEIESRKVQAADAWGAVANIHIGFCAVTFSRDRWRLAALFGWGMFAIGCICGWRH